MRNRESTGQYYFVFHPVIRFASNTIPYAIVRLSLIHPRQVVRRHTNHPSATSDDILANIRPAGLRDWRAQASHRPSIWQKYIMPCTQSNVYLMSHGCRVCADTICAHYAAFIPTRNVRRRQSSAHAHNNLRTSIILIGLRDYRDCRHLICDIGKRSVRVLVQRHCACVRDVRLGHDHQSK